MMKFTVYFLVFLDIDECQGGHSCDLGKSVCENLEGTYRCNCLQGYIPSLDGKSCTGKSKTYTLNLIL